MFKQTRTLGLVSGNIPFAFTYIRRRKENLIITCYGNCTHTYACNNFSLLSVCTHNEEITSLVTNRFHTFTAGNNEIYAWRRGVELKHTYKGHKYRIHTIIPFGPHIISIDESSTLIVWNITTEEILLELNFDNECFCITAACHPSTYINKILLGSEQGSMQLWNINTSKLIYSFAGWSCGITVLEQSPAMDVIAVGLKNGDIILHNLKFDETLVKFKQDWGYVTSIAFRTDGEPVMASGSTLGHIVFWNLQDRKVTNQMLNAHHGSITGLKFLPNEPLLVTSSPDNSLKLWIFDMPDGSGRLLRIREGHSSPPTFIRFHDDEGRNILSASTDSSLRTFNTVTELANKSLGRASYNRKASKKKGKSMGDALIMPPIIQFSSQTTREKEWDDIAAVHLGLSRVTIWSSYKSKMSDQTIVHDRFKSLAKEKYVKKPVATSVYVTRCGNFVIIGYSSGHVDRFNMQSGIHRGTYGKKRAHRSTVRAVASDHLNQLVITGGIDCYVKFWSFKATGIQPLYVTKLEDSVSSFYMHREGSMLAISMDDFSLVIIDTDCKGIVRKFDGHGSQIMDMAFSADSRWLVTCAMDCTIKIWDIPTALLIDNIKVDSACVSLTFSPNDEYLATAHVDSVGISLWHNRNLFSHVSIKSLLSSNHESESNSKSQISDLVTMSHELSYRWQHTLDAIKKRNKPKEPIKAPEDAPFFLPTIPSIDTRFDFVDLQNLKTSITTNNKVNSSLKAFMELLSDSVSSTELDGIVLKITELSSYTIYQEIMYLPKELILQFMKIIEHILKSKQNFELSQYLLSILLKLHPSMLTEEPELSQFLQSNITVLQNNVWNSLENQLMYCMCIVDNMMMDL